MKTVASACAAIVALVSLCGSFTTAEAAPAQPQPETQRPKYYFPRHIKRNYVNTTLTQRTASPEAFNPLPPLTIPDNLIPHPSDGSESGSLLGPAFNNSTLTSSDTPSSASTAPSPDSALTSSKSVSSLTSDFSAESNSDNPEPVTSQSVAPPQSDGLPLSVPFLGSTGLSIPALSPTPAPTPDTSQKLTDSQESHGAPSSTTTSHPLLVGLSTVLGGDNGPTSVPSPTDSALTDTAHLTLPAISLPTPTSTLDVSSIVSQAQSDLSSVASSALAHITQTSDDNIPLSTDPVAALSTAASSLGQDLSGLAPTPTDPGVVSSLASGLSSALSGAATNLGGQLSSPPIDSVTIPTDLPANITIGGPSGDPVGLPTPTDSQSGDTSTDDGLPDNTLGLPVPTSDLSATVTGLPDLTLTSGLPDLTLTSGLPDLTLTSGLPDLTLTSGLPDLTPTSGLPDLTLTSGLPDLTPTSGLPDLTLTSGLPDITPTDTIPIPVTTLTDGLPTSSILVSPTPTDSLSFTTSVPLNSGITFSMSQNSTLDITTPATPTSLVTPSETFPVTASASETATDTATSASATSVEASTPTLGTQPATTTVEDSTASSAPSPTITGTSAQTSASTPATSIVATGSDTATVFTVPSSIVFDPTTKLDPSPTGAGSMGIDTSTSSAAIGIPTTMPKLIQPPGGMPEAPVNSTLIQVGFTYGLNFPFVYNTNDSASQIFTYLPQGLAFALSVAQEQVVMNALVPFDTTLTLKYITTLAQAYVPSDMVDTLQLDLHNPMSQAYSAPEDPVHTIMSMINPAIAILPGANLEDGSGTSSYNPEASANANQEGGAPIGGDSSSSQSVKGTSAAIGIGAVAGAAVYAAAMVYVARRYREKKRSHRRASSVAPYGTMTERSPRTLSGGMGGYFMSGGNGLRGSGITKGSGNGRGSARVSRGSRSSAGSSNNRSVREQGISAPIMAENSLGWT